MFDFSNASPGLHLLQVLGIIDTDICVASPEFFDVNFTEQSALLLAAVIVGVAFIWYCGADARWRVAKLKLRNDKERAELEDNFRKTTAQVVGAAAVALVFAYNLTKDSQTSEQIQSQSASTTFAEGVKLFEDKDQTVRAWGIYLLERVASNRIEYREPIAYTLVSYIRSQTPNTDRQRLLKSE